MKSVFLAVTGFLAIALDFATPAQANEPSVDFGLAPLDLAELNPSGISTPSDQPLAIPNQAIDPPLQAASLQNPELPPPPPILITSAPPAESTLVAKPVETPPAQVAGHPDASHSNQAVELAFDPGHSQEVEILPVAESHQQGTPVALEGGNLDSLFVGGSDSLVARTVGSAEGTRTVEGHRTPAYYGHVDPGNGVWNLGSFSYQHGAKSPDEADARQLKRLKRQAALLEQQATARGLVLTLEETLNGIDLANQAPQAALDRGGYIDWLVEARQMGMTGQEAVLWARTRSFLDPDTKQWNAPGLGNTVHGISRDQDRRMRAIARALAAYQAAPPPAPTTAATAPRSPRQDAEADLSATGLERLMAVDLSPMV